MKSLKENENIKENNSYVKYFSGTTKLWNHNQISSIEKYFVDDKEIGRKILKNNSISYLEIFEDKRLNVLGLTKRISLLFVPESKLEPKNCIGFRYYEKNNKDKCNYFTLIKKDKKGYLILEKSKKIKDSDDDLFYNNDLDCYSIIKSIVYEKYKGNDISKISPNGELFPEIIGYTYSLISLGKFKNFIVLEPFILNRLENESLTEDIPDKLKDNVSYIEPIIYDNHVYVLLMNLSS